MLKHSIVVVVVFLGFGTGMALAQQCLHGANETTEQAARRISALTATRNINNIEYNQPGAASKQFLRHDELVGSPYAQRMGESTSETVRRISLSPEAEILPGWRLTLDLTRSGYWFMIKDTTDPCGFAYISNQAGVIFRSAPVR